MLHPVGTGKTYQDQPPPRPLLRTMLGEVLRRIRQDQRRTLAEVSRTARVSMQYLSELERGRKEASSEVLAAVCDALGMDLSSLLAEIGRRFAEDSARRAPVIRLSGIGDQPAAQPSGGAPQAFSQNDLLSMLAA